MLRRNVSSTRLRRFEERWSQEALSGAVAEFEEG
jgi:hypothetical protein